MNIFKHQLLKLIPSAAISLFIVITPAVAGDAAAGKAVYNGKGACATCHGATGAGDGVAAAALDPKPASFVTASFRLDTDGDGSMGTDADLANVIKNGGAPYGGNAAMPGRADFSDAEIDDLVVYIRTLQQ